jgi:hypothetical protein
VYAEAAVSRQTSAFQGKSISVGNPGQGHQFKRWVVSLQLKDAFSRKNIVVVEYVYANAERAGYK